MGTYHDTVFPEIDLPIHQGIGEVLHVRVGGDSVPDFLAFSQIGQFHLLISAMDVPHRLMELVCKGNILQRLHGIIHAVRSAFGTVSAHDHFRVVQEIAVDGVPIFRLSQMYPIRFYIYCPVTFL